MSKILANQFANFAQNGPVEALEGVEISPSKKLIFGSNAEIQLSVGTGTAGQYLTSLGSGNGLGWTTPTDSDTRYSVGAIDASDPTKKVIRLSSDDPVPVTKDITLAGINGISLIRSGDEITFTLNTATFPAALNAPNTDAEFKDITVASVTTSAGGLLDVGGDIDVTGSVTVAQDLTVTGNFTVQGDTTQLNVSTLNIEDNELIINSNVDGSTAPTLNGLLTVNRGSSDDVNVRWNETSDRWQITNDGITYYNIPIDGEYALTDTNTVTSVGISGNETTGTVTFQGSGATTVNQSGQIITISSTDTDTDTVTTVGTSGNEVSGNVIVEGSGATTVTQSGNTITISSTDTDTNTDTNTTYDLSATDGADASRKLIRLTDSDSNNDDVILKAGSNISLVRTNNEIEIVGAPPGTVTTYEISAEDDDNGVTANGAALRLTDSDGNEDDVKFFGSGATTIAQTDANTITISSTDTDTDTITSVGTSGNELSGTITLVGSGATTISQNGRDITISSTDTNTDTNTTYAFNAATASGGGAFLRLSDNIGSTSDVKLVGGSNVSITRNSSTEIEIGLGLPQNLGTTDSPTFDKIYYKNVFDQLTDLPNATTFHGMFAHVHATAGGYFAHGGNWIKLLDSATTNAQSIAGDLNVAGNLTVTGDTVTLNVGTLNVEDNEILLNSSVQASAVPSLNAAITVNRGSSNDVQMRWNETSDRWEITNDGVNYYNIPVSGEYATTDTDTVTRLRATATGSYIDGDVTLVAAGSASLTQSGNTITLTAANTDTVTQVGTSGNEVSGTITFQGSGATTVSQSGNTVTINSTDTDSNTITRVRGSNTGTYQSGDITVVGAGSALVTQSGTTITVTASDNNTITSIGTSGNAVTGTVVLAASGAATVSQIGQTITIGATDTDTTYTAGTGIAISGLNNEVSIGQAVGTTDSVTFDSLTVTNTAEIDGIKITNGVGNDSLSTGVGLNVLNSTTASATKNTGFGYQTLLSNQTGDDNTAVGYFAGRNTQGTGNTLVGSDAAADLSTGSYNTVIGYDIDVLDNTANSQLAIGSNGNTWLRGDSNYHTTSISFDGLREYTAATDITAGNVVALKQDGNLSELSTATDLTTLPTPTASKDKLSSTLATQWGFGGSEIRYSGEYAVGDHYNETFGGIVSYMYDPTSQANRVALTANVSNYVVTHRTSNILSALVPFTTQPTPSTNTGIGALGYLGTVSGQERYAVAVGDDGQISVAIIDIDGTFSITLVAEFLDVYNFASSAAREPNLFVEDVNNFFLVQHDSNNNTYMFHFDDEGGTWQQNTTRQVLSSGSQQAFYKNRGAARVGTKQWVIIGTNASNNLEIGHYTLSSGNQPSVDFTGTAPSLTDSISNSWVHGQLVYDTAESSLVYVTENSNNEPCILVFTEDGSSFTFGSWTNYTNASTAYRARNGQYIVHRNVDGQFWSLITGNEDATPAASGYRKLVVTGGAQRSSSLSNANQVESNINNFEFSDLTNIDDELLLGYPANYFIPIGQDAFTHRIIGQNNGGNKGTVYYTRKTYRTTYNPDPSTSQVIGIAKNTVTSGNTAEVQYIGTFVGASVATARDYFPNYTTSGYTASTTKPIDYPATFKPVGKALSGSELYIYDGQAGTGSGSTVVATSSGGGGGGATYTVSAETVTAGAELRLTGSDATTDGVDILGNNGITVTRTNADTITVDGANLLQNLVEDTTPELGGNLTSDYIITGKQFSLTNRSFDIIETSTNDVTLQHTAAGLLVLRSAGDVEIQSYQGSQLLRTNSGSGTTGGISLYYATGLTSEIVRVTTTSTGVDINGVLNTTSLNVNGSAYIPGNTLIDDDTFGTASATNVASAESIKAYVDDNDVRSLQVVSITGGTRIDLVDSDGTTVQDSFDIVGSGGATVSRFDADTITVSSADTTYTTSAVVSGSDVLIRLSGSDSSTDDLTISSGTGVSFTNVSASGFTIDASGAGGGLTELVNDTTPELGGQLALSTHSTVGLNASTDRANGNYMSLGSGTSGEAGRFHYFKPGTGPLQLEMLLEKDSDFAAVVKSEYTSLGNPATAYHTLLSVISNNDSDDTGEAASVEVNHGSLVDGSYVRYATTSLGANLRGQTTVPESTLSVGVYDHSINFGDPYAGVAAGGLITYNSARLRIIGKGSAGPVIQGSLVEIKSEDASETQATFAENGAVTLYHDNLAKVTTTSTGVQVTGTVDATAVTGDGSGLTGFTPLKSRNTVSVTTPSIADGASANISLTGYKSYMLLKIDTGRAAWVTLYVDAASRTADASRSETTDPTPGSGVIAEVITTGATSQLITPAVMGFNNNSPADSTIYAKVVNKSGSTNTISVTLTLLELEV